MWFRILLVALVFCVVAPAYADEWNLYSPCHDANLSERDRAHHERVGHCDPSRLAAMHAEFAAPPLTELVGTSGQGVRVTITNGYDRRILMTEVIREEGAASARVNARDRGDPGRMAPQMISADLDADVWVAIARRARAQASAMASAPLQALRDPAGVSDDELLLICVHSWIVTIETFGFGQPRVLRRDPCDDGEDVALDFAWRTVRQALAAIPGCDWLDQQFFRNDASRLAFCVGLSGERHIAAGAVNAFNPFIDDAFVGERFRYLLADGFTLQMAGQPPIAGADAAFAQWRAYAGAGDYLLYFDTAVGEEDNEWRQSARVNLLLIDNAWPHQDGVRYAEVTQTWRRRDSLWLLESMQTEPWQTLANNHD
jgi:hypothetical protein